MIKVLLNILVLIFSINSAFAHFLLLKPSRDIVENPHYRKINIIAKFTHPMEGGPNMDFEIEKAGVVINGEEKPLRFKVKWIKALPDSNKYVRMYYTRYKIRKPGVYIFFVDPKPYWEPSEEKFIRQITKVYVEAFGMEDGWDKPIGLKAEIIPLTRPFGIWEGNTFRGRVFINGKPAANVDVEVEYLNPDPKHIKAPAEPFITQIVKTDKDGYFEYTIPWSGWWGFSVIGDGGHLKYKDHEGPVELDAVLWVKAYKKPEGVK